MAMTTHLWKCRDCQKQILYTSKQKHPSFRHQCEHKKNKMTAENYALELLEKFSTRKDALIALDMCTTILIAVYGEGSWLDHIEETKVFLLKGKNYIQ